MANVCFAGITGWAAAPIVAAIERAPDLVLVSGVSRSAAGTGSVHATVAEALAAAPADELVDFTSASAVIGNVSTAIRAGVHAVIGTSGLTADDYAELDQLARQHGVGVIAAGNFSIMAAILRHAATIAAQHLEHWEIIDYASATKPDVPSGTARELAESLASVHPPAAGVPLADLHGPGEARGADVAGTRVHSVRVPSFVVSTEIVFGGAGERLVRRGLDSLLF